MVLAAAILAGACGGAKEPAPRATEAKPPRPSILLVTLDTTRADAIGPEASGVETPAFDALAARGRRFRQAYATVPETLPSHASMMTGLYAAGHGVHENARYLSADHPVLAERLGQAGYRTAAFVSSFVLARRFGLARGFDVYDDELPAGRAERTARETTDRAIAYLGAGLEPAAVPLGPLLRPARPLHPSRALPHPLREGAVPRRGRGDGRAAGAPRRGVRAAGRADERAIVVVGDHGEGLGEHGESQHGNLVYQATMHVPLVLVGTGRRTGRERHAGQHAAGLPHDPRLGGPRRPRTACAAAEPRGRPRRGHEAVSRVRVAAAGHGRRGPDEGDPRGKDWRSTTSSPIPPRPATSRTGAEPVAAPAHGASGLPGPLARRHARPRPRASARRNAGSSRASATSAPAPRPWCARTPRARPTWRASSTPSGQGVLPLRPRGVRPGHSAPERIRAADPGNLDAALRLATAHSALGHEKQALAAFETAGAIAPGSQDVRTYLALHYARGRHWEQAVPLLERIVAEIARSPACARGPGAACASARDGSRRPSPCARGSTRMRAPSAGRARPAR